MALGDLFPHGSISRFHSFLPALQGEPPADMLPDSQRRGVPEQQLHHLFFVLPSAHTGQKDTWTALFHPHRDRIDLQGSGFKQRFLCKANGLGPQKSPDTVGPLEILFTHAVSNL